MEQIRHNFWSWPLWQMLIVYGVIFLLGFLISFFNQANSTGYTDAVSFGPQNTNPWIFIVWFGLITGVIVLLARHIRSNRFWQVFFAVAAAAGMFITIYQLFLFILPSLFATLATLVALFALLICWSKIKTIWLHNIVVLLSITGVGRIFGFSFSPSGTIVILAVLAVYDYVAVFRSKHMVTLAKKLFAHNSFFGLLLPAARRNWRQSLSKVEIGQNVTLLGGGDLGLPLFFALSHLVYFGVAAFLVIALATIGGVIGLHYFFEHTDHQPLPALPVLVAALLLGHLAVKLFL